MQGQDFKLSPAYLAKVHGASAFIGIVHREFKMSAFGLKWNAGYRHAQAITLGRVGGPTGQNQRKIDGHRH